MNTKENGHWGKEETHKNHLKPGDKFDIRIRAHADRFQVRTNLGKNEKERGKF